MVGTPRRGVLARCARVLATAVVLVPALLLSLPPGGPRGGAPPRALLLAGAAGPSLSEYELDMTQGLLTLTFTQMVFPKTLNASQLTIQANNSDSSALKRLSLTGYIPQDANINSTTFYLAMTQDDYLAVLYRQELATSLSNSYVTLGAGLIKSIDMEPSVAIHGGLAAKSYEVDTLLPVLNSFSLDMDVGVLELIFNEPVNRSTFDPTGLNIQEESNQGDGGEVYVLVKEGVTILGCDGVNCSDLTFSESLGFNVSLGVTNMNAIKAKYPLCAMEQYTHLSATSPAIDDYAGNPMALALRGIYSGLDPVYYVIDDTRPELDSFALDMNAGTLTLYFSETVDVSTLDVTQISLQHRANNTDGAAVSYTLRVTSTVGADDVDDPVIAFSDWDVNAIKLRPELGVSAESTYVALTMATVDDMAKYKNKLVPIRKGDAQLCTSFTADITSPRLDWFYLDMDERILLLGFSEAVNASTMAVEHIVLQEAQTVALTGATYTLTPTTIYEDGRRPTECISKNGKRLKVALSNDDFNAIKVDDDIAIEGYGDTFLAIDEAAVYDIADYDEAGGFTANAIVQVAQLHALAVSNFTRDRTPPTLQSFILDLDANELELTFEEPVRASTLDAAVFRLLDADGVHEIGNATSRLRSSTVTYSPNALAITLSLSDVDVDEIKVAKFLARTDATTFLKMSSSSGGVDDMAGNALYMNVSRPAMQAAGYVTDTTAPQLTSFDLDVSELCSSGDETSGANLTLRFDEPVDASSFDGSGVTLQGNPTASRTAMVTLTDARLSGPSAGAGTSGDARALYVTLSPAETQTLLGMTTLGTQNSNTYVTLTSRAVRDLAVPYVRNRVVAIADGAAKQIGPALLRYVIDLDEGLLTLFFSEEIKGPDAVDQTGLALMDAASSDDATETHTFGSGATKTMAANGTILYVDFRDSDLDDIKLLATAVHAEGATFLSATADTALDVVGGCGVGPNELLEVSELAAMAPDRYVADTTRPRLTSSALDLNAGTLKLTFSEPVRVDSLTPSSVTLQSRRYPNASLDEPFESLTLSPNTTTTSSDGTHIVMYLTQGGRKDRDLDALKLYRTLAMWPDLAYIAVLSTTVADCATGGPANALVPVLPENATLIDTWTADTTAPSLVSFDLDMDASRLVLIFDEPVNASSFDVGEVTLQAGQTSTAAGSLTLSRGLTDLKDGARGLEACSCFIAIDIATRDRDNLNRLAALAMGVGSTFLSLTAEATTDVFGPSRGRPGMALTPVEPTDAMQVDTFSTDVTSPNLIAYSLDMDDGLMKLVFDEVVDLGSVLVNGFTLQYAKYRPSVGDEATQYVRLSNASSYVVGIGLAGSDVTATLSNDTKLEIQIGDDDLNAIKAADDACIDLASTWLVVETYAIADVFANPVAEVGNGNAEQATNYTADITRPSLVSFSLYATGDLTLRFSETVDYGGADVSAITLLDDASKTASTYGLTAGDEDTSVLNTGYTLNLLLDLGDDFTNMRQNGIGDSQASSYLRLTADAITDMAGNMVLPIAPRDSMQMGPVVESFSLDMDEGVLVLTMSERVRGNGSLDVEALTLRSYGFSGNSTNDVLDRELREDFALTANSEAISMDGATHIINLGARDVEALERKRHLAVSAGTTFLTVSANGGPTLSTNTDVDSVGAPLDVVPIENVSSVPVATFVGDTTRPSLTTYELDRDAGTLTLNFSETVDAASFNVSQIVLQDLQTAEISHALGDHSTAATVEPGATDDWAVRVTFSNNDYREVAALRVGDWLTLTEEAAEDTAHPANKLVAIADGAAQAIGRLIPDTTAPVLEAFAIDLDGGLLTLNFSEPVDPSNFNATEIVLSSTEYWSWDNKSAGTSYKLTDAAQTFSEPGVSIVVDLATYVTDLNAIKSDGSLAVSLATTFLSLAPNTITDMAADLIYASNPAARVTALAADKFVSDTTAPLLRSFDYTSSSGLLELHFDEPMDYATVDVTAIVMYAGPDTTDDSYRLTTSGTTVGATSGRDIELTLSSTERAGLTAAGIASGTGALDTYIRLDAAAAADMAMVENYAAAAGGSGDSASDALLIGPVLVDFVLDMDDGVLTMLFSEKIETSTFNVSGITLVGTTHSPDDDDALLYGYGARNLRYTLGGNTSLTADEYSSSSGIHLLTITMSSGDLDGAKLVGDDSDGVALLATKRHDSYVALAAHTGVDEVANPMVAIKPADALQASRFTADTTKPTLKRAVVDMDKLQIRLTFDEPVQSKDADVTHITVQGTANGTTESHTLIAGGSDSRVITGDGLHQIVRIGLSDSYAIKLLLRVASRQQNSYLSMTANTWFDRSSAQNPMIKIETTDAYQADTYVADATSPKLKAFDLDMDDGILDLSFDEPVSAETLDVTSLRLQQYTIGASGSTFTLTNASYSTSPNSLTLRVYLSQADRDAINFDEYLAYDAYSTFAIASATLVDDVADNALAPTVDGVALAVRTYGMDTTSPTLVGFTLDMDDGVLVLSFSEPVRPTSFDVSGLTFYEADPYDADAGQQAYTLTDASAELYAARPDNVSATLTLTLAKADRDAIKALERLALGANSSALGVSTKTVADLSGNRVEERSATDPFVPSRFWPDVTNPTLDRFDLDMDAGTILLEFSEAIDSGSVDLTAAVGIELCQFASERAGGIVKLSGGDITKFSGAAAVFVSIALTFDDMNALKLARVGYDKNHTWLTLATGTFSDMVGLPVVRIVQSGVVGGASLRVTEHTPDTTAPTLERFVVDRSGVGVDGAAPTRALHLTFSEAVDVTTLAATLAGASGSYVTLLNGEDGWNSQHTLEDSTVARSALVATELVVSLAASCVNEAKANATTTKVANASVTSDGAVVLTTTTKASGEPEAKGKHGNFSCDWEAFEWLEAEAGGAYGSAILLSLGAAAVLDLALPPNEIAALSELAETAPFCGPCEAGRYLSSRCDTVYDAVCTNCTACSSLYPDGDHYQIGVCDGEYETSCERCQPCPQGTYDAGGCGDTLGDDRVCDACVECGPMEYETSPCTAGANRICGSCKVCTWSSEEIEIGCGGSAIWWRQDNCCFDTDENMIACNMVDLEDLRITARNSRKHWVYKTNTPPVEGYTQEEWGPG